MDILHMQFRTMVDAEEEIERLRAALKRIDGLNDNPSVYNADIDAVLRDLEHRLRGSDRAVTQFPEE